MSFVIGLNLHQYADRAFTVQILKGNNNTAELNTINDIEAMAFLGKYYASKIQAAVGLALLPETQLVSHHQMALKQLDDALKYWSDYTRISETNYKSQMLARTYRLDWSQILGKMKEDIELAKEINSLKPSKPL